jgi:hypothetical protein
VTSSPNWVVVAIVVGVVAYSALKPWLFDPQRPAREPSQTTAQQQTKDESASDGREPDLPIIRPKKKSSETLQETRPGAFESKAGLVYGKGGAQGNRLDHVLEHAKDDLSKPTHGVFLGSREEILALIDEAWETAQKRGPPDVKIEDEGERTVYTVDLKRKVGYLGGQSGKRKNHPALTGLRLVLEGRNVITAFPVAP